MSKDYGIYTYMHIYVTHIQRLQYVCVCIQYICSSMYHRIVTQLLVPEDTLFS